MTDFVVGLHEPGAPKMIAAIHPSFKDAKATIVDLMGYIGPRLVMMGDWEKVMKASEDTEVAATMTEAEFNKACELKKDAKGEGSFFFRLEAGPYLMLMGRAADVFESMQNGVLTLIEFPEYSDHRNCTVESGCKLVPSKEQLENGWVPWEN